ncbi:MAG: hypothetical protein HOE75_08505 [Chloroflexi bacterium]|nr:hypothetical protein [Chloroflexota bacterium]
MNGGIAESDIGTLSRQSGAVSLTYSGAILAFGLPLLFFRPRNPVGWLIVGGAVLFAIVGEKQSIAFFVLLLTLELIVLSLVLVIPKRQVNRYFVSSLLLVVFVFVISTYASVRLIPSLNPEQRVWGSFSPDFVLDYSWEYVWRTDYIDSLLTDGIPRPIPSGRLSIFRTHLADQWTEGSVSVPAFGYGPGTAVESSLHNDISEIKKRFQFNGVLTGFDWLMLQTGMVGALAFLMFWLAVYYLVLHKGYRLNYKGKIIAIIMMLTITVVLFDIIAYGTSSFTSGILFPFQFIFIAAFLTNDYAMIPFIRWVSFGSESPVEPAVGTPPSLSTISEARI